MGSQTLEEKIDAILHMDRPQNASKLHMLIGCVYHYRVRVEKACSNPLEPHMQTAFNKMSVLMAANTLAAYSNHNKRFNAHTDASDFQLGVCIVQEGQLHTFTVSC
ncbi:hypothetical protein ACHAW6_003628 [Cyclotella cf. meneghiniana]